MEYCYNYEVKQIKLKSISQFVPVKERVSAKLSPMMWFVDAYAQARGQNQRNESLKYNCGIETKRERGRDEKKYTHFRQDSLKSKHVECCHITDSIN